ncbi:helix-turn-helix transcriptional regulator [Catalinimonas alkaloidigena]|uniref:helix-turn-helix transcriptional regulator n=1 Tax=Catalinimonas alkaloidigena TaxID=1075417 RepID=UPI001C408D09|nr:WYL domain-containing protein [Catalinimonas alkaloidigena]
MLLFRLTSPPYTYPDKARLFDHLQQAGLEVSETTFERDKKELKEEFGLQVRFSKPHQGYYLYRPPDEDVGDFHQFLELLERWERLSFFLQGNVRQVAHYLQFEQHSELQGAEHLPLLWRALREQRCLRFAYQPFQQQDITERYVEPCLLLEDRNRWYLVAWSPKDQKLKTFGVERMRDPQLTEETFTQDRRADYRAQKAYALGVHFGADQHIERVVLRFATPMVPYLKTLPLHATQRVLADDEAGLTVELDLVLNPELERELLGYAEYVEVLAPQALRQRMAERLEAALTRYQPFTPKK